MTETKAFGTFVRELKHAGVDQGYAVALYVEHPYDNVSRVRYAILKAKNKGAITAERADSLSAAVDTCYAWYQTHGKIIDHTDPEDWNDLGNGAHMRRTHMDSDNASYSGLPSFAGLNRAR